MSTIYDVMSVYNDIRIDAKYLLVAGSKYFECFIHLGDIVQSIRRAFDIKTKEDAVSLDPQTPLDPISQMKFDEFGEWLEKNLPTDE